MSDRPRPRPTTTARGYGVAHRTIRRRLAAIVDAGLATCSRCGAPIVAGSLWDLDHRDDRAGYLGAAHRKCNRGWRSRLRRRNSREW